MLINHSKIASASNDLTLTTKEEAQIKADVAVFNTLPSDKQIMVVTREEDEKPVYACVLCCWKSFDKRSVTKHVSICHQPDGKACPCKQCHISFFENQQALKKHQNNQCTGFPYAEPPAYKLPTDEEVQKFMQEEMDKEVQECMQQEMDIEPDLPALSLLERKLRNFNKKPKRHFTKTFDIGGHWKCSLCQQRVKDPLKHAKTHNPHNDDQTLKNFPCLECNISFFSLNQNLKNHKKLMHSSK